VDLVWPPYGELHRIVKGCLEIMSKAVDAFLIFTYHPIMGKHYGLDDETFANELRGLSDRIQKPIFLVLVYPTRETQSLSFYTQKGIPAYPSIGRATKGLSALVQYSRYLREG